MPERGETLLEMAVRHVAAARRIVEVQHRRVAEARGAGDPTLGDHEKTLEVLENSLRIFEHDERKIREQLL